MLFNTCYLSEPVVEKFDSEKEMQRHKYTNKKKVAGKDSWLKTSSVERVLNGWDRRKAKERQSNKAPVFLPNSSASAHLSNALTLSRKFAHPHS